MKDKKLKNIVKNKTWTQELIKTNFESIYNRNKIRNEIIPYLKKEFNPNVLEGINRLSNIAREEEEYFDKVIAKEYEELKIEKK